LGGDSLKGVQRFIEKHSEDNLYWTPNALTRAINKKAKRTDISCMRCVHLDKDDPSESALQRIRSYHLKPTMIVASGGGYNAYWLLDKPIHANGNIDRLEDANRRVILDLGGDIGTQNLDRILRLPGTINWPTKTKLARGRVAVKARLIDYNPQLKYRLDDFRPVTDHERRAWEKGTKAEDRSAELLRKVLRDVKGGLDDVSIHAKYDATDAHAIDQANPSRAVQRCIDKARKDAGTAPLLTLRTASDIVNNPVPAKWLLKPYLEQDVTAVIAGDYGTFKSFLCLDWCLHIATGKTWHGDPRDAIEAQPVIFISAEGRGLAKRIRAWAMHHSGETTLATMKFYAIEAAVNLSAPEWMHALVEAIDALGVTPALVVVDTLNKNSSGVEESNSNMQTFLNTVNTDLRMRYRCAVLLVHHVGHTNQDRARGPISLVANTDAMFMVERTGDSIALKTVRLKDSEVPPPIGLRMKVIDLGLDSERQPQSSLVLTAAAAFDVRVVPKGSNQRKVWDALTGAEETTYSKEQLWKLARSVIAPTRVPEAITGLCASAWIVDRGAQWEFLK